MHSNKSQNTRLRALANFKAGKTRVLVASDIAARGLDVDNISHVFNYDLPNVAETYVNRIGRTGRAGARGQAISFCSEEQRDDLREIERLLGKAIPVLHHSIKTAAPVIAEGGLHPRQVSARTGQVVRAAHKPATPQQQKDDFWRSRRKRRTQGWAKPRYKRRGR
jgi:ATP-dependent RNA helicase RhlE